ncbi:MAG TPA: hypothetical protein VGW74_19785 [Propionibacteriaceae bacterium]|nr:hypothetical protein [Propionibacteriaceae bacterium]
MIGDVEMLNNEMDWHVFHAGQPQGPYGRVVPAGRVVLRLVPHNGPPGVETVVEQSPEQLLTLLARVADEVRPDAHAWGRRA